MLILVTMIFCSFVLAGLTGHAYTNYSWAVGFEEIGYENTKTGLWLLATIMLGCMNLLNFCLIIDVIKYSSNANHKDEKLKNGQ